MDLNSRSTGQHGSSVDNEKLTRLRCLSHQKLMETGEKDRLTELLRTRLLECGWREELVSICKEYVKTNGVEGMNIDDMINEVTPRARQMVPDSIKRELLQRIRQFLITEVIDKSTL